MANDQGQMTTLRLGVIGLGRRWQRGYLPALQALRDRFTVVAVFDQVPLRSSAGAQRLRCAAAAGPAEMLERPDLDAVLMIDAQWFGLWPVELACRAGKPVLCAVPLESDQAHADALCRQVAEARLPVLMELAPRLAPATGRLRELLAQYLGPARLVLCDVIETRPGGPGETRQAADTSLLDWCVQVLGPEPASVRAIEGGGMNEIWLEWADGRAARVARWYEPRPRRAIRCRVVAERGTAGVRLPDRLTWSDPDGRHALTLRGESPPEQRLLRLFYEAVTRGQPTRPGLDEAARALRWLRAAARSLAEGQRVVLSDSSPTGSGEGRNPGPTGAASPSPPTGPACG